MLKEVAFCSLCCFPFYLDKHNKFIPFCIISIIAILLNYYENRNLILAQNPDSYGGGGVALSILPIGLYLLRDKKNAYSIIWAILTFILVLTTIKRGAIVACICSIIVYFGYRMMSLRGRKVWNLLIFVIVGILLYVVFFRFVNSSDIFQSRFEATLGGYTSNRDYIYTSLINHFFDSPLSVQIFGNGFNSCWAIAGNVAHNDWLELLTDTGIIGCSFYFLTFISLFRSAFKLTRINDRAILLCICTIWIVESMVSMFIFATSSVIYFILIGYIFGNEDRKIICKVKK